MNIPASLKRKLTRSARRRNVWRVLLALRRRRRRDVAVKRLTVVCKDTAASCELFTTTDRPTITETTKTETKPHKSAIAFMGGRNYAEPRFNLWALLASLFLHTYIYAYARSMRAAVFLAFTYNRSTVIRRLSCAALLALMLVASFNA